MSSITSIGSAHSRLRMRLHRHPRRQSRKPQAANAEYDGRCKQMPAAMPTAMAITTAAVSISLDNRAAQNLGSKHLNPFLSR